LTKTSQATDVGKRDLPPGVRNRFTELYVSEPSDDDDLRLIVSTYAQRIEGIPDGFIDRVVAFYKAARGEAACRNLRDGNGR
jgi:midasin